MKKKMKYFTLFAAVAALFSVNNVSAAETLQSKVDAAESGSTIVLDADYSEGVVVSGKKITIDLNGHSITVDGHAIYVRADGELVLTGNGKVESTKGSVVNEGITVINGGTYNSSTWYTVKNFAKLTINNGNFTQGRDNKGNSSLIVNGWYNGKGSNANDLGVAPVDGNVAELTINGGDFKHYTTTSTIKSDDWSKTVVTGGTFKSENGYLLQATGDITISGGTFDGYKDIATFCADGSDKYEPGVLRISAGTFTADYVVEPYSYDRKYAGTLEITGGVFNVKGITDNSRYTYEYNKTVVGGTYSFDITDEKYIAEKQDNKYVVRANTKSEASNVLFESETPYDNDYELIVSKKEVANEVASKVKKVITDLVGNNKVAPKDITVLGLFDIHFEVNDDEVEMVNGKYNITLTLDKSLMKYSNYKVVYVDENGAVKETFDTVVDGNKIKFTTTHLSDYGVVGYNTTNLTNPSTGDNLVTYVVLSAVSLLGIAVAGLYVKKSFNA